MERRQRVYGSRWAITSDESKRLIQIKNLRSPAWKTWEEVRYINNTWYRRDSQGDWSFSASYNLGNLLDRYCKELKLNRQMFDGKKLIPKENCPNANLEEQRRLRPLIRDFLSLEVYTHEEHTAFLKNVKRYMHLTGSLDIWIFNGYPVPDDWIQ
jgi:hypothetical protein